ncbi:hypothetical protein LEMLEM_LOCUS16490 [Lemmus lemmus]
MKQTAGNCQAHRTFTSLVLPLRLAAPVPTSVPSRSCQSPVLPLRILRGRNQLDGAL